MGNSSCEFLHQIAEGPHITFSKADSRDVFYFKAFYVHWNYMWEEGRL